MGRAYDCLGERAPLSLSPSGAFQLGGLVRNCALLVSSEHIYAWHPAGNVIDEREVLEFVDGHEPVRGEFLLLGTGPTLVFPSPSFRAEIDQRGLGLEAMDTSAACRTFNVLVAEGRRFTAALLPVDPRLLLMPVR